MQAPSARSTGTLEYDEADPMPSKPRLDDLWIDREQCSVKTRAFFDEPVSPDDAQYLSFDPFGIPSGVTRGRDARRDQVKVRAKTPFGGESSQMLTLDVVGVDCGWERKTREQLRPEHDGLSAVRLGGGGVAMRVQKGPRGGMTTLTDSDGSKVRLRFGDLLAVEVRPEVSSALDVYDFGGSEDDLDPKREAALAELERQGLLLREKDVLSEILES